MHMIDTSNQRANMAFTGRTPWHGLGTQLDPGADVATWQRAAGLEWQAKASEVLFETPLRDGEKQGVDNVVSVPDRRVIYRDDTDAPLGIVSDRYKLVQPGEVLDFFNEFVQAGDLELETAGSLAGGRRIWALANLKRDLTLAGGDTVNGYLLLATSMDGSLATVARFTSVRVVCQNTLNVANRYGDQPQVRVPHNAVFNPEVAKAELGLANDAWASYIKATRALSEREVSDDEALAWLLRTFGDPNEELEDQPNPRILKEVWECVEESPGADLKSAKGTAWGLVNGATFYLDHVRGKDQDRRLDHAWFGRGHALKQRALTNALALTLEVA